MTKLTRSITQVALSVNIYVPILGFVGGSCVYLKFDFGHSQRPSFAQYDPLAGANIPNESCGSNEPTKWLVSPRPKHIFESKRNLVLP